MENTKQINKFKKILEIIGLTAFGILAFYTWYRCVMDIPKEIIAFIVTSIFMYGVIIFIRNGRREVN